MLLKSTKNLLLRGLLPCLVVSLITSTSEVAAVESESRQASAGNDYLLVSSPESLCSETASLYKKEVRQSQLTDVKRAVSRRTETHRAQISQWGERISVLPWTRLELAMIIKHKAPPGRAARALALLHTAMHDAVLLSRCVNNQVKAPAPGNFDSELKVINQQPPFLSSFPSEHAAVAAAAAAVLGYLFPSEQGYFDSLAEEAGMSRVSAGISFPSDVVAGFALGRKVGASAILRGQNDGAARGWNGEKLIWHGEGRPFGPGYWEPTPPYNYYPPDEPYAPYWRPWLLNRANQFRPEPPPFGSKRYMAAVQEVKDIADQLTAEQQRIAKYWVDGSGSVTPAGHWIQITIDAITQYQVDEVAAARLLAVMSMGLADAYIAAWDTKYAYWTARPVTSIRTLLGVNFKSYILTPPFPSYISGHATFSGMASEVLARLFPKDAAKYRNMGEEAALSRLYGGIHYRFDNDDGLLVGRKIAHLALSNFNKELN